jgi:hypothetical protein
MIPDYDLVLVQLTTDVVRIIDVLRPTVVEWQEVERREMLALAVMVPQIRCATEGNCGIVHGATADRNIEVKAL